MRDRTCPLFGHEPSFLMTLWRSHCSTLLCYSRVVDFQSWHAICLFQIHVKGGIVYDMFTMVDRFGHKRALF